ncbi:MAG: tetratricopeptide repeat protein [Granulosicoccus sp.]
MKSLFPMVLIGFVLATGLAWSIPKLAAKPNRFDVAMHLLAEGHPDQAVHLFQRSQWRGVAQYRNKRYRRAISEFFQQQDLVNFYNLGNAYAQVHEWAAAKTAYERALRLDPGHEDAQFNLELVRQAEELEKALLEESRDTRKLGSQQDGDQELPTPQDENSDNIKQGTPEGGVFRPAAESAQATAESQTEGRLGEEANIEQAQAGIAPGAQESTQSDGDLTGSSSSSLLRESHRNLEILLSAITDNPERVLRARLVAVHKSRTQAMNELHGDKRP